MKQDYAKQITAEEKQADRRGFEKWVAIRVANHLLDSEIYALAVADWKWSGDGANLLRPNKNKIQKKYKVKVSIIK